MISTDNSFVDPKGIDRSWKIITPPTAEPITVDELKLFARIDGTSEDILIEGFIEAVREATELYLGRALMQQTIRVVLNEWHADMIELPRPPLISVSSIETVDEDDTTTTYSSSNYFVVTEAIPGQVIIKNGATPPTNTDRYYGGYRITFLAGYGTKSTDVPRQIRTAMMLWASAVYENRSLTPEPPPEARPLLDLYRVIKI